MRFSISLLSIICVASVIGTVVQQNQSTTSYINQFGPFWHEVFGKFSLYTVYSAWWFLLILAFLVLSTSLCISRNAPKILHDLRNFKETIREQSLRSFHHKTEGVLPESRAVAVNRVSHVLAQRGYKFKLHEREGGVMIAAKAGSTNKLGYIAAHSAIVLVCIGGLLDGDMIVRAYIKVLGKSPATQNMSVRDVPEVNRLSAGTPAYRGNVFIPEGGNANYALLNFNDGVMVQDLPFTIKLDKFVVEHYSTGMPKLFASDVQVTGTDGKVTKARVEVNKPLIIDGVAIYQSSFDDGGSKLKLRGHPMTGMGQKPMDIEGEVGGNTNISKGADKLTLEFTGLRVFNVENMATNVSAVDVRKVTLTDTVAKHLGSGAKSANAKQLRNVGPSVTYKLRDAAGQAREFHNYQFPVELDGVRVYLAGLRDNPNESFRYLRIPADDKDELQGFMLLRAALADPALRATAVARFADSAVEGRAGEAASNAALREQIGFSAGRALDLFAGALPAAKGKTATGGLQAVSEFLEGTVPAAERNAASEVLLKLLNGTLYQLYQAARSASNLAPAPQDEASQKFLTQAVLTLSDTFNYGAPMLFELADFTHIQASVFQVAKAPGKTLVYLGCFLLIVGVFAMLYVRERRLWVLIKDAPNAPEGQSSLLMALSTTRKTLDFEKEFTELVAVLHNKPAINTIGEK